MNSDSIKSGVLRLAGIALGWAAGRYHLSSDTVGLIMSDVGYVGAAAAFAWGFIDHWGKIKVPAK